MASITPLTRRSEIHSDFHKDLALLPGRNDIARRVNENSVKEAIKNILLTDRGERLFQPRLGSASTIPARVQLNHLTLGSLSTVDHSDAMVVQIHLHSTGSKHRCDNSVTTLEHTTIANSLQHLLFNLTHYSSPVRG